MKHVLVVDDEKTQLIMLAMIVLEFGTEVALTCSFTYNSAKEHIENNNVDVLITDFNLFTECKNTGTDLIQLAKEKNIDTKTILISSLDNREKCNNFCDLFLEKPINRIEFVEQVKECIN